MAHKSKIYCLHKDRDRYYIKHNETLDWDQPLLLCGSSADVSWSTDQTDAKPFQYLSEAVAFAKTALPGWGLRLQSQNCSAIFNVDKQVLEIRPLGEVTAKLSINSLEPLLYLMGRK